MDVDVPEKLSEKSKSNKSPGQPSATGETASKYPKMDLAQRIHRLLMMAAGKMDGNSSELSEEVRKEVLEELENPSLYRSLQEPLGWLAADGLDQLEKKHTEALADLEGKVEEAKESAGDMEVLEARLEIARYAAKSCDEEKALAMYDQVLDLPKLSTGKTIDALMECARVASFHGDLKKNAALVERASKLAQDGGDWDRRNRLKVYSALSNLLARNVKEAADLLVDCIATFSCNELCSYDEFVVYTVLSNIPYLPRPDLKRKIIDGPEILSVSKDIPEVINLVTALYDCDYKAYLHAMVEVHSVLIADRFLQPHAGFLMRELHVLGYKQFLDSYKSVTLKSMAVSFGVTTKYLDLQLSRFIAAGRLTAKIDKYGGVVETNRPDLKNAQYRDMIQEGDLLLNRIQKLARVVDL